MGADNSPEAVADLLKQFDTDGDGKINLADFKKMLEPPSQEAEAAAAAAAEAEKAAIAAAEEEAVKAAMELVAAVEQEQAAAAESPADDAEAPADETGAAEVPHDKAQAQAMDPLLVFFDVHSLFVSTTHQSTLPLTLLPVGCRCLQETTYSQH